EDFVERLDGCRWIYDDAGFTAVRSNQMERAIEMHAGFLMHRNPVCAGFRKGGDELIRAFDHQVAVEHDAGKGLVQRSYYRRTNGDVRHEVAVHDVDVEQRTAAFQSRLGILGKPCKVSGQDGRREFDVSWRGASARSANRGRLLRQGQLPSLSEAII